MVSFLLGMKLVVCAVSTPRGDLPLVAPTRHRALRQFAGAIPLGVEPGHRRAAATAGGGRESSQRLCGDVPLADGVAQRPGHGMAGQKPRAGAAADPEATGGELPALLRGPGRLSEVPGSGPGMRGYGFRRRRTASSTLGTSASNHQKAGLDADASVAGGRGRFGTGRLTQAQGRWFVSIQVEQSGRIGGGTGADAGDRLRRTLFAATTDGECVAPLNTR